MDDFFFAFTNNSSLVTVIAFVLVLLESVRLYSKPLEGVLKQRRSRAALCQSAVNCLIFAALI